jgi:hypothetical protein
MFKLLIGLMAIFLLSECSHQYNVYFWFGDNPKQYHLGVVDTLDACGSVAHSYAQSKNLTKADNWGYICCLKTSTSECAEKHR